MDSCTCSDSVPKDSDCKLSVNCFSLTSNLSYVRTKDSFIEKVAFLQSRPGIHRHSDDSSKVSNLVDLFETTLQVHNTNRTSSEQLKNPQINLDGNGMCSTLGDGECEDVKICHLDACSISSEEVLEISDAFPSKKELIRPSQPAIIEDALCMTSQSEDCPGQGNKLNASSHAIPVSFNPPKIISAMKGSRERQGLAPKAKMSVKWAPDVYDPPVTLMSHTVKSSLRRSKAKKDKHRHKHKGGKVSRGSHTGRNHFNRNIPIDNDVELRLQGTAEKLSLSASSSSATKLVEFTLNSNDTKCGSSFLDNPLARVHLSLGKAS